MFLNFKHKNKKHVISGNDWNKLQEQEKYLYHETQDPTTHEISDSGDILSLAIAMETADDINNNFQFDDLLDDTTNTDSEAPTDSGGGTSEGAGASGDY
jgi:hypothetical protein